MGVGLSERTEPQTNILLTWKICFIRHSPAYAASEVFDLPSVGALIGCSQSSDVLFAPDSRLARFFNCHHKWEQSSQSWRWCNSWGCMTARR